MSLTIAACGSPESTQGETNPPDENEPQCGAAILIELEPGIEPGDIILLEAYQNLMMHTPNDAIVLF